MCYSGFILTLFSLYFHFLLEFVHFISTSKAWLPQTRPIRNVLCSAAKPLPVRGALSMHSSGSSVLSQCPWIKYVHLTTAFKALHLLAPSMCGPPALTQTQALSSSSRLCVLNLFMSEFYLNSSCLWKTFATQWRIMSRYLFSLYHLVNKSCFKLISLIIHLIHRYCQFNTNSFSIFLSIELIVCGNAY